MTRSVEIPEAAVEAAAKVIYVRHDADGDAWDGEFPVVREEFHETARDAMSAALPYLAPAGDGGLREALAELVDMMAERPDLGVGEHYLRELLAAHPAAPAVPQPVDREAASVALAELFAGWSGPGAVPPFSMIIDAVLAGEQEQVEG